MKKGTKAGAMVSLAVVLFVLAGLVEIIALALFAGLSGPYETLTTRQFVGSQLPVLLLFCLGMLALGKSKELRKEICEPDGGTLRR